ncbi:MAG: single-stranded DNA-binding protein [Clostridiales bacterium]|nr:single-stranded DNA-binding protein [Bacillota bacterium]NLL54178.1 single-stranded DNA-binding protein [Clostridiales bacterium]
MMNKAILIGNLTRDPELRTTQSGISVCTFTLAVNRRFANQQGIREADFIPIVTWRQQAELCSRYLSKGSKVAVAGMIQTRTYDAQDGTRRYVTEVVADEVEFLGSRNQAQYHEEAPLPPEPSVNIRGDEPDFGEADSGDDELPF